MIAESITCDCSLCHPLSSILSPPFSVRVMTSTLPKLHAVLGGPFPGVTDKMCDISAHQMIITDGHFSGLTYRLAVSHLSFRWLSSVRQRQMPSR